MVTPCKGDSEVWLMRREFWDTDRWTGHGKSFLQNRRAASPPDAEASIKTRSKREDTVSFARTTRKPPSVRRTLQ